ncbi:MAG: site-specific integrase [Dethiobacteria bacterium]
MQFIEIEKNLASLTRSNYEKDIRQFLRFLDVEGLDLLKLNYFNFTSILGPSKRV